MKPFLSPSGPTLFQDRNVFEFDYVPEQFNYRVEQLQALRQCLLLGSDDDRPRNVVLRGAPGTGKTTCVEMIFAELENCAGRVVPVYVNCRIELSPFSILSRIYFCLFGHAPPPADGAAQDILEKIGKTLMEREEVMIVCFDDANTLLPDKALNSVLFLLLQIGVKYPGANLGIVASVSSIETDLFRDIDPYVMSLFQPLEISFPPYSRDETKSILQDRVHRAIVPGAVPEQVLDVIVDRTASCGDIRMGLELVRRVVERAEAEGLGTVDRHCIESALVSSQDMRLKQLVGVLTVKEKDLLAHIARLTFQEPISYLTMEILFHSAQMRIWVTAALFHQWVKKFIVLGLISLDSKGARRPKRAWRVVLKYDPVKVIEVCEGTATNGLPASSP